MPVPDEQKLYEDFTFCEYCAKTHPDSFFQRIIIDNDKEGAENQKRVFIICHDCRGKCRADKDFEKYVTEKTFRLNLGRRIRIEVEG